MNPYQSPGDDTLAVDRPIIGLRSYHVPFIIAAVCGLALAVICNMTFVSGEQFAICVGVCGTILVFDIPVCGLVLFEWWRTGEPPRLNFEPLIASAERRALYRTWKERPQLDDESFYQAFYADSGIPQKVVVGVRSEMQAILGRSLAGVHPHDDMALAEPELDLADVFYRFDETFEIVIRWRTGEIDVDGTFDSLVRLVADCVERRGTE